MISIADILMIVWTHFIADFILQSTWMSNNKWESLKALGLHSFVYTIPFLYFGWLFALFNGVFHFLIDGCTSKITHELYNQKAYHWFFVVIGFDQVIHMTILFFSYWLICLAGV